MEQELLTLPEHLSSPSVVSGIRVTRSLVLYVCFVDRCLSFCTFSFGHCVVCSSSIYGFWLPLWVSSNSSYVTEHTSNKHKRFVLFLGVRHPFLDVVVTHVFFFPCPFLLDEDVPLGHHIAFTFHTWLVSVTMFWLEWPLLSWKQKIVYSNNIIYIFNNYFYHYNDLVYT